MSDDIYREIAEFKARTLPAQNGCIEWSGNRDTTGYGRFCFKRRIELAHRAAWRLFKGPVEAGQCVLHKCDNPPCVNPDHLFLGDRGDNARDMSNKGRQWIQRNPSRRADTLNCPPELRPRGESHGNAKLSEADVLAIRRRAFMGESNKALAIDFNCTATLISQVVRGQIWKHVGGPIRSPKTKKETS